MQTRFQAIRSKTLEIVKNLEPEDFVVQPTLDVSPPKWHLAHTTWFFETFVLAKYIQDYQPFHPLYSYLFNSYYEALGNRVPRQDRGLLSRPTVREIMEYRGYVDHLMDTLLSEEITTEIRQIIELGLQHEQQHQELLVTDVKYILGHNPLFPGFHEQYLVPTEKMNESVKLAAGIYDIGFKGNGFCFDNELQNHQVLLQEVEISGNLVTNAEYIAFIEDKGYKTPSLWLADGWAWVQSQKAPKPLYWKKAEDTWYTYETNGIAVLDGTKPLIHVNYYEADAFANWLGMRLPTEFEWEAASDHLKTGLVWEWTSSAYLPYPKFKQLRGRSVSTMGNLW